MSLSRLACVLAAIVVLAPFSLGAQHAARRGAAPGAGRRASRPAATFTPPAPFGEPFRPDSALADLLHPPTCTALTRDGPRATHLRACPRYIASQVEQWNPEALVVLGGGILSDGDPGCATEQRAYTALEMFERLGRRPVVVMSGAGPRRPPRPLTPAARRCALARRAREIDGLVGAPPAARRAVLREAAALERARAASLTEAEYMCAAMLRAYPEGDWDAVLAQVVFEPRSYSTAQNAAFSAPILAAAGFRRVMLVSSPTFRGGGVVENHARRAARDFRAVRPRYAPFRVAAIACMFGIGGPSWAEFE